MSKAQLARKRRDQIAYSLRHPGGPPESKWMSELRSFYHWPEPVGPEPDVIAASDFIPPDLVSEFAGPIYCTATTREAWLDVLMGSEWDDWRTVNEIADRPALEAVVPPATHADDWESAAPDWDAYRAKHPHDDRQGFIAAKAREAALRWEPGDEQP